MFKSYRFLSVTTLTVLALAGFSYADVLMAWNAQGISPNGGPASWDATTVAPNMLTSNLTRTNLGNGDTASFGANRFTVGGDGSMPTGLTVDTTKYVSFTAQPSPGYKMTLTSLDYALAIQDNGASTQYEIRYSVDGFASPIATGTLVGILDNPVALANATIAGVTDTSDPVEFRLYEYGANNGWITGSFASRNNNTDGLIVNGSVVVPEPGTLALLAFGSLAILRRAKPRKA